ncbi:GGDEF domain-containing protein [Rhabdothermincola salaria]|uniref:GGDEF domain-containing protein n=1 Tax=Rhabdothermincola salaria TaxID=2903142 RepID=UPI001E3ED4B5|nr:diguanylate cyclase [Rhabdothermincola salaria]MCD9625414.1 diguanylate cyclase [Rhabdothermincola salaria]
MDRRTPLAAGSGLLAVVAGVSAALGAPAAVGLVAALAGAMAAVLAVGALTQARASERRAVAAETQIDGLRGELHVADQGRRDAEARLEWRTQLTAVRRATEDDHLTDATTGLLAEGWFVVALESRLAGARRNLRPVAVVVLDVVVGLSGGRPAPADPRRVAAAVTATIREADDAFRLRDGVFALLLDDTTDTGAMWTAERVRDAIAGVEPDAVLWAGVACYPAHGLTTDEVLDRADTALDAAREWRQHRIEVATSVES